MLPFIGRFPVNSQIFAIKHFLRKEPETLPVISAVARIYLRKIGPRMHTQLKKPADHCRKISVSLIIAKLFDRRILALAVKITQATPSSFAAKSRRIWRSCR